MSSLIDIITIPTRIHRTNLFILIDPKILNISQLKHFIKTKFKEIFNYETLSIVCLFLFVLIIETNLYLEEWKNSKIP